MEAILLGAGVGLVKAIESGLAARSVSQLFGVMDNIVSHPLLDEELDKVLLLASFFFFFFYDLLFVC
jgi:hypothetical protein